MKQLTNLVASLLVSTVACSDTTEPPQQPTAPTATALAASCDDLGDGQPLADGEYMVYVGSDATRPWKVYCKSNLEYLSLTGLSRSELPAGGDAVGTTLQTSYNRVRIDPVTLMVDVNDTLFATTTGRIIALGVQYDAMPFGVAMACAGGALDAHSTVDLSGTSFMIASHYVTNGVSADGGTLLSNGGQAADIYAHGDCGTTAPNAGAAGWVLQLAYMAK